METLQVDSNILLTMISINMTIIGLTSLAETFCSCEYCCPFYSLLDRQPVLPLNFYWINSVPVVCNLLFFWIYFEGK